jgi:hypothetical protein
MTVHNQRVIAHVKLRSTSLFEFDQAVWSNPRRISQVNLPKISLCDFPTEKFSNVRAPIPHARLLRGCEPSANNLIDCKTPFFTHFPILDMLVNELCGSHDVEAVIDNDEHRPQIHQ